VIVILEKKVLIFGFGRMGVSHALQICGLLRSRGVEFQISIIETSIVAKLVAKSIFCGKVHFKSLNQLMSLPADYFDYAVDATPPFERVRNRQLLERISKRYLIEKPLRTKIGQNGQSGYVLQHNPLIDDLKRQLQGVNLSGIEVALKTNLVFKEEEGWRSGKNGGVVNEFLGHLLSVPFACLSPLKSLKVECVTHKPGLVDVLLTSELYPIRLVFEYGCSNVRKSTYNWRFYGHNAEIVTYDCYQIGSSFPNLNESHSIATLGVAKEFYLRGFDFCSQAVSLIDGQGDKMGTKQLECIDSIISGVLEMVTEK